MNCFGKWGLFKLLPHFLYFLLFSCKKFDNPHLLLKNFIHGWLNCFDIAARVLHFDKLTSYRIKVAIWFMIVNLLSDCTTFFNSLIMPDVILPVNLSVSWCAVSSICGKNSTLCCHQRLWSFLLCRFPDFRRDPPEVADHLTSIVQFDGYFSHISCRTFGDIRHV